LRQQDLELLERFPNVVRPTIGFIYAAMLIGGGTPPPKPADSMKAQRSRIVVGDTLNCPKLVQYVRPLYPKEAKEKHIQVPSKCGPSSPKRAV
jgi:hypothetical protein